MKTGHKGKRSPGDQVISKNRTDCNNITGLWTYGQLFIALTDNRTTVTADTFFGILEQIILAHYWPPNIFLRLYE
jgi:hypothetical protein